MKVKKIKIRKMCVKSYPKRNLYHNTERKQNTIV